MSESNCVRCGKSFPRRSGRGRPRSCCSASCERLVQGRTPRAYKTSGPKGKTSLNTCIVCGQDFPGRIDNRFCSDACKNTYYHTRPIQSVCVVCGNWFTSRGRATKTCSKACLGKFHTERQTIPAKHPNCICEGCGKTFKARARKSKDSNRFCSRECCFSSEWFRQSKRERAAKRDGQAARTCRVCGKSYQPSKEWKSLHFCSDGCRRKMHWHTCEFCGKDFQSQLRKVKYCSQACGLKQLTKKRHQTGWLQCAQCGRLRHLDKGFNDSRLYCSPRCAHRACKNKAKHVRRQRIGSGPADMITIGRLIKRDNGICYHCGVPIDATAKAPEPLSPTIDHFIPLSKQGKHRWDNVVLAHFACNVQKADAMPTKDGQRLMFPV